MSILWFDSLDYASVGLLDDAYGATSGWAVGAAHPTQSWRSGLTATVGSTALTFPANNNPAEAEAETCFFGFSLSSSFFPSGLTQLAVIYASGAVAQLRVKVLTDATTGDRRIEVWSGDQRKRFLATSYFDTALSPFVEVEAEMNATTGRIVVRINGTVDTFVDNIDTLTAGSTSWQSVDLDVDISGGHNLTFADFYLASSLNGFRPPGVVNVALMWPGEMRLREFQWGFDRSPRLVIMLGQNNMDGNGDDPATTSARNPNSDVSIWNVENQTFEFIDANVNTGSAFSAGLPEFGAPWGPEMAFAEDAAVNHERTGATNSSQTYIIKLAALASWSSPIIGSPSWHPSVIGNLSDSSVTEIDAAVASLGGWGLFPDVDIFWHQGESEALSASYPNPSTLYTTYSNDIFDHFETELSSTTVHWHRTVMHEASNPELFLDTLSVMAQQRSANLRGSITETSDLTLSDTINLDIESIDKLGSRYFQRWMERRLPLESQNIQDALLLTSVDTRHLGGVVGASMESPQSGLLTRDMIHSPGMAISSKSYSLSDVGEDLEITVGGVSLPDIPIAISGSYLLDFTLQEVNMSPEQIAGDVKYTIK